MKGCEGRQMKGNKAAAAAKSSPEWRPWRGANEGTRGGSGSQEQLRMEIVKGDKWRETNEGRSSQEQARMEITKGDKWRQEQLRAAQNGDHAGRQMKGDKWRQERPRAGQNGDHGGRQMKAGPAKSRPEWRSRRETNEGTQIWKQEQPRAGQNGDHEGRHMKAGGAKSRREWRSRREINEAGQSGDHAGRQWRETRWQRQVFGDQQSNLWEVRTPIASSYLGKNKPMWKPLNFISN